MTTLQALINQNPKILISVTNGSVTERVNHIRENVVVMDSGANYPLNQDGWSLVRPTLGVQKTSLFQKIDNRTQELINNGFDFDGRNFSLSSNAQQNWTALATLNNSGMLTFPLAVTTANDDEYEFDNQTEFLQFIGTAFSTVNGHIASGRALKVAVRDAQNQTQLDAIIDNR